LANKQTKQKYLDRLAELIDIGNNIATKTHEEWAGGNLLTGKNHYRTKEHLAFGPFVEWRSACVTVLDAVIPKSSLHRKSIDQFASFLNKPSARDHGVSFLRAIKRDFEDGFFESLEAQIDAEISSDYLHQAEQLLTNGKSQNKSHIPAAVLSGAVLERGLRSIATALQPPEPIEVNGKALMLGGLIDALKKRQLYNELTAKQLRSWADIRNAAAHGKFDDFNESQTKAMVSGIADFLARHQL
jgi:hypothetical protein